MLLQISNIRDIIGNSTGLSYWSEACPIEKIITYQLVAIIVVLIVSLLSVVGNILASRRVIRYRRKIIELEKRLKNENSKDNRKAG